MGKKKHRLSASSQLLLQQDAQRTYVAGPNGMATPTLSTTNFTRVNDCNATTNWSNIGGGPGVSVNADVLIQGTGALGRRVDNGTGGYALDLGTANTLDFSPGGANEGEHIFFWVNILQPDLINGMYLRLSEDASVPAAGNSLDYEIFPANPYSGGWYRAVIDPRATPAVINGSASHTSSLNAVRWIGFFFDMGNVGGTSPNCNIDAIDRGRGLIVTGGSATDKITWDTINTVATSNANAYGLIEKRSGVFFMKGEWQFGDATNNCYFQDNDQTVVWEGNYTVNRNATPRTISAVADDLNRLILVEGTGTTDFINGIKSGTGNDATGTNGCAYQTAPVFDGVTTNLAFDFSDADITNVELFGCRFRGCTGSSLEDTSITFCSDATNGPNHEVSGCVFDQCGLVDPGRVSMQNNLFSNSLQPSKSVPFDQVTYEDSSATSFTNVTTAAATREGANTNMWPLPGTSGDAIYLGFRDKFLGLIETGSLWSDSISSPTWEYFNESTGVWTTLGTVTRTILATDATSTTNVAGATVPDSWQHTWGDPANWGKVIVNSGPALYFVRLRNGAAQATGSGNAQIGWAHALPARNGAAMLWNANGDVVNCSYVANTDADTNEKGHGIEHRLQGSVTYNGLTFSGNDADILLSDETDVAGNYPSALGDTDQTVGNGTIDALGQSFTGNGETIAKAVFQLKKTGTPTGNAVAKIYAHSGTYGTSSVPTGAALATSLNFNVATLTGTYAAAEFLFEDNVTLTNATNYVLVLEYTGGDGTNYVQAHSDTSAPTHPGNFSSFNGTTWTAASGTDLVFTAWTGLLFVSASGGADPTTFTVVDNGHVVISNTVNVTLTGLIGVGAEPDTEVRVYTAGTTTEVAGQENVSTGSFTFQANATDVVDIRIHNVEYEYTTLLGFTVPSNDVSIPIQQRFDRNYSNP
jgi:hypothetical protein